MKKEHYLQQQRRKETQHILFLFCHNKWPSFEPDVFGSFTEEIERLKK